jgi:lysophospholipase L1-like esterase
MDYFTIIIVLVLIIIIVTCAYFNSSKEGLTNNNSIILMGDSILNNAIYVPNGESVVDYLKKENPNVLNVAKDGATITDLYVQLDNIPLKYNNSNTYLFISIGGNDILHTNATINIVQLFNKYLDFLKALRVKLGNTNINILNLYLPANPRYNSYKPTIEQWNQLINKYSNKVGEMYNVIDIYSLLNQPEDFVYDIEPSTLASQKIANIIYLT